jgi:hypothetical protein
MKAGILAVAAFFLLSGVAVAASSDKDPAYASIDHVTYYVAAGVANGSYLAAQTDGGEARQTFIGCAYAQLRPDNENGRVFVAGLIDNYTPLMVEVGDFAGGHERQGGVATNLTLDQGLDAVVPAGKTVASEAAAWGTANLWAGLVPKETPFGTILVPANFTDPVGGGEDFRATYATLDDGLRDAASGNPLAEPAKGQGEMHVVVQSPEGATPTPDHVSFVGPANVPQAEHAATYDMLNSRFGGQATVTFTATANAPPGLNELTIRVLRPDGTLAGNASVSASVIAPGKATLKVPLSQMGTYTFGVTGKMLLGTYTIDVQLDPAPVFQLDFWWDAIARGDQGRSYVNDCQKEIGLVAQVRPVTVGRHKPPHFPLEVVAMAAVGSLASILLLTKYITESVAAGEFRRAFRK